VMGRNGAHSGGETNDGYYNFGPVYIDTTGPVAVTTMTATASATTTDITLLWSFPNDRFAGTLNSNITAFRIQYNTYPNPPWDSSQYNVRITTSGVTAGTTVSYTASGLLAGTSYYFALWSEDYAGNISDVSNIPVAITTNVFTARPVAIGPADNTADCIA